MLARCAVFDGWQTFCCVAQGKQRGSKGKGKGQKGKGKRPASGHERATVDPYGGQVAPPKKKKRSNQLKCFNCGGHGHISSNCPSGKI